MPSQPFARRALLAAALACLGLAARPSRAAEHGIGPIDCPTRNCGRVHDPAIGDPEHDVPPRVAFADLPDDWVYRNCGRVKDLW